MSTFFLQEPQRNRNATANFVNLIRTSTVCQSEKYFLMCSFKDFTLQLNKARIMSKGDLQTVQSLDQISPCTLFKTPICNQIVYIASNTSAIDVTSVQKCRL